MYLRFHQRLKEGKEHRYWHIVESKRCAGGKVVQRPVLYLGEINDSQREAWCRVIEALDEESQSQRQLALFPASSSVPEHAKGYGVQVRLDEMELHGNGGRAGFPVISMSSSGWTGSLRSVWKIRAKGRAGKTSLRRWCATG